ncbi:MAG: hypothetical protein ABIJ75_08205 [Actinomycetota bacterium]
MRRQFAALIAVLGLVAAACTSSAGAENTPAPLAAGSGVSTEEAQATRLVEDFFASLQQRNAYALYALFVTDDQCRPPHIEALLADVELGIAETSEVEVAEMTMREIGSSYSLSFVLIEHQGASEKELEYKEFFPLQMADRWRFAANICEWLASPSGDSAVQEQLGLALTALQAFHDEHDTYLATGNDLRYYASGLKATMDELAMMPGDVLVVPGDEQALLVGQGVGGAWYCIAVGLGTGPVYGSGSTIEDVILYETCAAAASAGGW